MTPLNPKEMAADLVGEFAHCKPEERIKIAHGYAAHVEAYAQEVARRDVRNTLRTVRMLLQDDPEYTLQVLDSRIAELSNAPAKEKTRAA